jgi:hypothetical protein
MNTIFYSSRITKQFLYFLPYSSQITKQHETVCFVIVFEAKITVMLFSMLQKNNEISKQSRNKLFRDFLYLTNKKYITLAAILLNDISEC